MFRFFSRLQRVNGQRHIYSIRTAFIAAMPIFIVGAYAVVLNQMPIAAYQRFMEEVFGSGWRNFGALVFNATTQLATLMIVFQICSNLANWYNGKRNLQIHTGICGMMGLACYVVVSLPVDAPTAYPFEMAGVTGLFVAMVVAVASLELFLCLYTRKETAKLFADDPNVAVPQSFASILPVALVVAAFALVRILLVSAGVTAGFSSIVNDFLRRPFMNSGDSMGTAFLYNLFTHVLWLFGIHGNNVLDGVAQTVFLPAMQANIQAAAAGLAPPNLITKTTFDAFVYMGGSGTTLALLIALLLFGQGRSYRTLMRFALPNAVFNINEPLVFGIPVVLNPIYAIPFVATPLVMFSTTAMAMRWGLVPYATADISWATPIFVSGYAATGSFSGVALQAVNLALAVAIYAPFVRLAERMAQLNFQSAYRELVAAVTDEYSPSSRHLLRRVDEVGAVARRLANQLPAALEKGELYLNYQPIVDANANCLHSVEALMRWKHPQHGLVNHMVTIALAEETGYIHHLGLWILEQAAIQRAAWTQQELGDFHVAVNVSSRQLDQPDFHRHTLEILARHGVPPCQIQVEITETAALVENAATSANLKKLCQAGCSVAMDDFGVGHSSLLYLRTQPITTLKIDGKLSREVITHPANLSIIATIYELCRLMGVDTIIEYVDNPEQLEKLLGIGTFLVQGYLYSPPIAAADLPRFTEELTRRPLPKGAAAT